MQRRTGGQQQKEAKYFFFFSKVAFSAFGSALRQWRRRTQTVVSVVAPLCAVCTSQYHHAQPISMGDVT
jgi:hypothetical protein